MSMNARGDAANEAPAPCASAAACEDGEHAGQSFIPAQPLVQAVSGRLTERQELQRVMEESLRLSKAEEMCGRCRDDVQSPAAMMLDGDVGAVGAPAVADVSPPVQAPPSSALASRLPSYQDLLDRRALAHGDRVFCTQRKGKRFFGDLLDDGRIRYSSKCVLVSVGVRPKNGGGESRCLFGVCACALADAASAPDEACCETSTGKRRRWKASTSRRRLLSTTSVENSQTRAIIMESKTRMAILE